VKSHQNIYWHERCKADQLEKKSLQYLQIQDGPISIIHFLNYPGIFVFSGGAFPVYFSD
jgi:hypothetical protein